MLYLDRTAILCPVSTVRLCRLTIRGDQVEVAPSSTIRSIRARLFASLEVSAEMS